MVGVKRFGCAEGSVNNTKQIKPFLLLVQTRPDLSQSLDPTAVVQASGEFEAGVKDDKMEATISLGELYRHDPNLTMKTTYHGQALQAVRSIAVRSLTDDG